MTFFILLSFARLIIIGICNGRNYLCRVPMSSINIQMLRYLKILYSLFFPKDTLLQKMRYQLQQNIICNIRTITKQSSNYNLTMVHDLHNNQDQDFRALLWAFTFNWLRTLQNTVTEYSKRRWSKCLIPASLSPRTFWISTLLIKLC